MLSSLRLLFGSFPVFLFSVRSLLFCRFPLFLRRILSLLNSPCGTTRAVREWGGVGGGVLGLMCVVTRICNLICQPDSQFRIPVQIHVPQGTGDLSSAYHTWVRSHNRYYNLTVYPPRYVRKCFVYFIFHGSNQFLNYGQGFPPYHSIYSNNKRR